MRCSHRGDPGKRDRKVIRDVNVYGWHVTIVSAGGGNPNWAYSIGLFHTFRHPEIVVFGLDEDLMHQLINHVGREAKAGREYAPDREYDDILEGYGCTFRPVDPSWYHPVLNFASWFYGGAVFPALQLIWPDSLHRYPWEPGFESRFVRDQPLLFRADPVEARGEWLLEPPEYRPEEHQ
jgi:hypothetical protein